MPQTSRGRVCVTGSFKMFDDDWLLKEENARLLVGGRGGGLTRQDVLMHLLHAKEGVGLNEIDAKNPDVVEPHAVPDLELLSTRLRCCLHEADAIPHDFNRLFDQTLFKFDTSLIPDAVELFKVWLLAVMLNQADGERQA
jgi:intraflagellar transport protein 52